MLKMSTIIVDLVSRDRNLLPKTIQEALKNLENKNKHPRDEFVTFSEGDHSYSVNGNKMKYSCTTVIKKYFSPFEAAKIAKKISAWNKGKKTSPYFNKSEEDILKMWEREADLGTMMHANIEFLMNIFNSDFSMDGYRLSQNEIMLEMSYFDNFCDKFIRTNNLEPFRTEWLIYDENAGLAGSIDMVLKENVQMKDEDFEEIPTWVKNRQKKRVEGKDNFWIFDWKRTKKLSYEAFAKKGQGTQCSIPNSYIEDCNFSTYSLQLNLYRTILEKNYGINIIGMCLVVIHPNNNDYKLHLVPFLEDETCYIYKKLEKNEDL